MPRDERDAGAWNLEFRTLARRFCAFGTEKCYVEIGFGARNSLSCSRYSPCRREKLSEMEFYLRYLCAQSTRHAVFVRRQLSYRACRFEFCAAFGALVAMRIAPHSSCAIGIDTVRTASAPRRCAWVIRALLCMPHKASSFEILREAPCISFDVVARDSASFVLCVCDLALETEARRLCVHFGRVRDAASEVRR